MGMAQSLLDILSGRPTSKDEPIDETALPEWARNLEKSFEGLARGRLRNPKILDGLTKLLADQSYVRDARIAALGNPFTLPT